MSTAALASARRRRTTNDIASSQNVSNKTTQQESPNSSKQVMPTPSPQSLTPLQILQLHDNKLKDLEALMIELNSEDYITNVVEEKINALMQEKLLAFSSELDKIAPSTTSNSNSNSDLEAKIQIMETSIQTSIQTNLNIQNIRLDEFKENTIKMIELLTSKENHVSSTNVITSNVEKIDMLTKEVNELKLLVIKSQTLALETCNSILSMKDEFKLINEKIMQNANKISAMNSRQCNAPQCDPTQMFLQSFMKNNLFGGGNIMNMGEDYEEADGDDDYDDETKVNMNKKLHIDLNNEEVILNDEEVILNDEEVILNDEEVNLDNNVEENLNTEELIIDENQLQEILESSSMDEINLASDLLKQEVIDEIRKIETNVTETNVTETNVAETNVAETNVAETNVTETN